MRMHYLLCLALSISALLLHTAQAGAMTNMVPESVASSTASSPLIVGWKGLIRVQLLRSVIRVFRMGNTFWRRLRSNETTSGPRTRRRSTSTSPRHEFRSIESEAQFRVVPLTSIRHSISLTLFFVFLSYNRFDGPPAAKRRRSRLRAVVSEFTTRKTSRLCISTQSCCQTVSTASGKSHATAGGAGGSAYHCGS